jgi:pimeloyl-ACP methyl ester carboxylesterase
MTTPTSLSDRSGALVKASRGVLALTLLLPVACNVVERERRSHERALRAAGLKPAQVSLGADTVHYWEGGSRPAVVLVHGFGADALWQWHPQVGALAGAHRLIIPDLLWFGGSSSIERDFSMGHQVRMLVALADRLGVRQASWVGISYGGLVAYELARLHPDRVRRLVLIDSPGRGFTSEDYRALCQRFSVERIGDLLVPSSVEGVKKLSALAYARPPWMPDFAGRQMLPLLITFKAEKLALIDGLLAELRAPPTAAKPHAPTLIIWGRDDQVFPLYLAERLRRTLPGARLEIIADARHAPNLEHPDAFNRILAGSLGAE